MKDSTLKRVLLQTYFSAQELKTGLVGAFARPPYVLNGFDYDAYWRLRQPGSLQPRFFIIEKHIRPRATLLDVGCGDGAMLEYLARCKVVNGVGIDISSVAVETARKRGVDARVQTLEQFLRENGPNSVDNVVISEVLEHVPNPETFVRQGWDIAASTLWLTFPNIAYFPHRLRLLFGNFPIQWTVFPGEHLRFWSLPDFLMWLRRLELPDGIVYPSNGITFAALHRLWPNLFANQIVARIVKQP